VTATVSAKLMRAVPLSLKLLFTLMVVAGVIAGAFFWKAHANKRSIPGRIVRWFEGKAGAHQTVNDLADDIRQQPALAQLQPWSVKTLELFRAGAIRTNGSPAYWSLGTVRLAPRERPTFMTQF